MVLTDAALRLVGIFYAFAGYAATRAALTSLLIDRAIAAIGGKKPCRIEIAQSLWLLVAATVILIGGVALALLSKASVWLFVVSAAAQALYLYVLAPRFFDVEDPPSPAGRRQSQHAFAVYLVATASVLWAESSGRLLSSEDVAAPLLWIAAAAIAAHVAYVLWSVIGVSRLSRGRPSPPFDEPSEVDEPREHGRDPSQSRAIKLVAKPQAHPLWALDDDLYGDFPPEKLGLSPELLRDLAAWADARADPAAIDQSAAGAWTEDERRQHKRRGKALAVRLARERPDLRVYVDDEEHGVIEVTGLEGI